MRVAVLSRLDPNGNDTAAQSEKARAYEKAVECLIHRGASFSGPETTYSNPLQESWQNVVEFAGYFTGLDMSRVGGAGHQVSILPHLGDDHWYLVGTQDLGLNISQPKGVAAADLNALIAAGQVDIAFIADERGGQMLLPDLPPRVRGTANKSLTKAHYSVMTMACIRASAEKWQRACAVSTTYKAASEIKAQLQALLPTDTVRRLRGPIFSSPNQDKGRCQRDCTASD